MGRKRLLSAERHRELRRLWGDKSATIAELAERFDISTTSAFRYATSDPAERPVGRQEVFIDSPGVGSSSMGATPAKLRVGDAFKEFGISGLQRFGGSVMEDYLQDWAALSRMVPLVKRMIDHPTISAILFAVEMTIRSAEWSVEPVGEEKADKDAAEFLESCLDDMSHTMDDHVVQALTMVPYGFAPFETVYKRRRGPDRDPASNYDDGLIGWRKFAYRAPETLSPGDEWVFDEAGGVQGMNQSPPPAGQKVTIPIEKMLLYRTTSAKNNPQGRALAVDTPIPTPDGWRTMGELQIGDRIFDENGNIRHVVAVSEIFQDRPCYSVQFNMADPIIADAEHLWFTQNFYERSKKKTGRIRATAEMAIDHRKPFNGATVANYSIPWAAALRYVRQEALPISPYVLGLWLGDGHSRSAIISAHEDDAEELVCLLSQEGYDTGEIKTNNGRGVQFRVLEETQARLRLDGLLMNKHVPRAYMMGSPEQRLGLLQGLMDSDGHVTSFGQCEFMSTNIGLAQDVLELVRSLGCAAALRPRAVQEGLPAWRVQFTPASFVPFRLLRKRMRRAMSRARSMHYIQAIEEADRADTVCIQTDAPGGLFLAGAGMVPTHNSALRGAYIPWYFAKNLAEIEGISAERMGAGVPVIYLGGGTVKSGANSDFDSAKKVVRDLAADEQAGVVFPHPKQTGDGTGMLFELVSPPSRGIVDFHQVIERYNQQIAQTLLAQFIFLGMTQRGTQALAVRSTDFFTQAIDGWTESISQVFNKFAVPRLFRLNSSSFPNITGYPKVVVGPLGTFDVTAFVNAVKTAADAGALTKTIDVERAVRVALELPEPDDLEERITAEKEQAAAAKAEAQARLQKMTKGKGDVDLGEDDEDDAGGRAKGRPTDKPDTGDEDEDDAGGATGGNEKAGAIRRVTDQVRELIEKFKASPRVKVR